MQQKASGSSKFTVSGSSKFTKTACVVEGRVNTLPPDKAGRLCYWSTMQNRPAPYPAKWLISKDQAKAAAAVDDKMREKIRAVLAKNQLTEAAP